ncbi:MAG: SoxR reducing system RseC family protein [Parashewanella sp.]
MIKETARVIGVEKQGWISVEVEVKSACHSCHQQESCGSSAVSKAFKPKSQQFSMQTELALNTGDKVVIGLPESVILKAAALVYLLPLFGFFLFALLGSSLFSSTTLPSQSTDLIAIFFGAAGGILAWYMGKSLAKLIEKDAQPVVINKLANEINTAFIS